MLYVAKKKTGLYPIGLDDTTESACIWLDATTCVVSCEEDLPLMTPAADGLGDVPSVAARTILASAGVATGRRSVAQIIADHLPLVPTRAWRSPVRILREKLDQDASPGGSRWNRVAQVIRKEYVRRKQSGGAVAARKYLWEWQQRWSLPPRDNLLNDLRDADDGEPIPRSTLVEEVFSYAAGTASSAWSPAWTGHSAANIQADGAGAAKHSTTSGRHGANHATDQAVDHEARGIQTDFGGSNTDFVALSIRNPTGTGTLSCYEAYVRADKKPILNRWVGGGGLNLYTGSIQSGWSVPFGIFLYADGSLINFYTDPVAEGESGLEIVQVIDTNLATQTRPGIVAYYTSPGSARMQSWQGGARGETVAANAGGGIPVCNTDRCHLRRQQQFTRQDDNR